MAVFRVGNVAAPLDEINQYHLGRYISSNEAVWRILSFPIHERHPTVVHLAVHLENGQRVYFLQQIICATYRQACQELNLIENDAHWDTALADASNTARPQQIRTLFAIILATCFPSNPKDLWEKYKDYMSEDIPIVCTLRIKICGHSIHADGYNEALTLIEDICLTIANKALLQLGMPASNRPANNLFDRDLQRKTHYDSDELGTFVRTKLP
ncbi:ATP-dependent DNA helicase [Trichonephila clavipes]|nr:ATP-dependent DNA helicase [Trichonephila clavipes]